MKLDAMREKCEQRPHAVCIPFPIQGHITPMLQLAKLLHHSGFYITFVHSAYNHARLLRAAPGPASMEGLPGFRFETIPDGLPPTDSDVTQDIPLLCDSTAKKCLAPFRELLNKLQRISKASPEETPPVTCVISDGGMSFTLDAAQELGLPVVMLWALSAAGILGLAHYPTLKERGLIPLKDESQLTNGYLDTEVEFIPGMEGIRLKELPTILRTTNPDDVMLNFTLDVVKRASRADAMVFNTFDALEHDVMVGLSQLYASRVLSIGPLHAAMKRIPQHSPLRSLGSSLWRAEPECVAWLNSKETGSVVYVSFGSITTMSSESLVEFAWGLAGSRHPFLWAIRPDLVEGDAAVLPPEFLTETKGEGLLTSWCPQEEVLNHPSVGGFLTHCGWNSTLESLAAGVPTVTWPFFTEQQTTSWFARTRWGTGVEIGSDVGRGEVERLVRELMGGEKGREMKRRAMEWKRLGEEAIGAGGSSSLNLDRLVNEVLKSSSSRAMS